MVESFCLDYDFQIDSVSRWVKEKGFKKVVLQLPPALQRCAAYIVSSLAEQIKDVEFIVSANPSYGACLVDEATALAVGAEAIIHFGHVEYPLYKPSIPTLFVPLEWVKANLAWLTATLREVCEGLRCCVVTTAQHLVTISKICRELGIEFKGIVLGCLAPDDLRNCEKVVVVAGGDFHCVSLALRRSSCEGMVCIDPYAKRVFDPCNEFRKILKIRMWKIYECLNAKKWLIVNGLYGQNRSELMNRLKKLVESSGGSAYIASALSISENVIRNLDSEDIDCIVITACPRIAIDDMCSYEKPVLTPGEALMVLTKNLDRYVYPW